MSIQTQKYARPSDLESIGPRSATPFQTQTTHQSAADIPSFGTARPSSLEGGSPQRYFMANGLFRYTSCRMVVLTVRLFLFMVQNADYIRKIVNPGEKSDILETTKLPFLKNKIRKRENPATSIGILTHFEKKSMPAI